MKRTLAVVALCCGLVAACATPQTLPGEVVEGFSVREGGAFNALSLNPEGAREAVLLVVGGNGVVNISESGRFAKHPSFVVRARDRLAAHGLRTVLVDAPADHRDSPGLKRAFRLSKEHATDIAAVIARLRDQGAAKVWLVGTSRGSISAASVAARLGPPPQGPDGIVLTSSVVSPGTVPTTVLDVNLSQIVQPTLIVYHQDDQCPTSHMTDDAPLRKGLFNVVDLEFYKVKGGEPGRLRDVCTGRSHHGFLGLEGQVANVIVAWIRRHEP